jgi:DNA-binding transcriptional MerR regulator
VRIKDFAKITGISESAIRYYERIGVLHTARRLKNGYREFGDEDVQWMDFVTRLRKTGMPIVKIVEFSKLRELGNSTLPKRMAMLEEHERRLIHEIDERTNSLQKLREKIALYRKS